MCSWILALVLLRGAALGGGTAQATVQRETPRVDSRAVRVVVCQELERDESPVPGLRVALGCAPAGSFLGPPGTHAPLATVTLDEQGEARVELELPPGDRTPSIWAQVVSPGFQQWVRRTQVDPRRPEVCLSVPGRAGGTLYGVVRAGAPSAKHERAKLRLVEVGADASAAETLAATADDDGRFFIHFPRRGRYHLQAAWKGLGLAVLRDLALDPAGEPARVELDLGAGLTLAGRVLDPDGEPVHPFTLSALPEGFDLVTDERVASHWWNGLFGERVVSDEDGRFAFHGLPPGRYALAGAFSGPFGGVPPELLGSALHAAGEGEVTVEARVHRMLVRVLDDDGKPLALGPRPWLERTAQDPVLFCGQDGAASADPFPGQAGFDFITGTRAIEVARPGTELRLAFAAPHCPLVERMLCMPEEPWLVTEELRLPPPVEPALLHLRVEGGSGECELSLFSASGVDVTSATPFKHGLLEARVPPGAYRLSVRQIEFRMCWSGDPEDLVPAFAPAETPVELLAGQTTRVEVTLRPSVRLKIALELPRRGTADEIQEIVDHVGAFREPLRPVVAGAKVELWRAESSTAIVPEFSVETPELELRALCLPYIAPGRECISISAIPPGTYRLVAVLDDGRRIEREVELPEGSTTTVTLAP